MLPSVRRLHRSEEEEVEDEDEERGSSGRLCRWCTVIVGVDADGVILPLGPFCATFLRMSC